MLRCRTSRDVPRWSGGFTLVEVLVVITIIGILVGMLLPAVNYAREAGRNAQCRNNLKQMGEACLAHEQAQENFPTGGWGWFWVGDPDRGYGVQQPGGWIYNILPHTEQNSLHDLGHYGTAGATGLGNVNKVQAIQQMVQTPVPFTNCPTRRRGSLFNYELGTLALNSGGVPIPPGLRVARSDYAISCGSAANDQYSQGPASGADALGPDGGLAVTAAQTTYLNAMQSALGIPVTPIPNLQLYYTGISFQQSTIRKDDVRDGCSNRIMLGEKYVDPQFYATGQDGYDNETEYQGFDNDIGRATCQAPMQDRWGNDDGGFAFGSAHATAANFVLCDGSVISINYAIAPATFVVLGTRASGLP